MSLLLSHLKAYDMNTRKNNVQSTKEAIKQSVLSKTSFSKGELLKGEVVDLRSKQATIKLNDGTTLHGQMEGDVDLYIGQKATFEVTSEEGQTTQIKIIRDDNVENPQDALANKALSQAGLPNNMKNREAVKALLDANLSIDKQSIQNLLKVSYQFPKASMRELVFLQKHNIPVNEESITMLNKYQSSEHRIMQDLEVLTNDILNLMTSEEKFAAKDITQLLAMATEVTASSVEGDNSFGSSFFQMNSTIASKLNQMFEHEIISDSMVNKPMREERFGTLIREAVTQYGEQVEIESAMDVFEQLITEVEETNIEHMGQNVSSIDKENQNMNHTNGELISSAGLHENNLINDKLQLKEICESIINQSEEAGNLDTYCTKQQRMELASKLQEVGISSKDINCLVRGEITGKEILNFVKEKMSSGEVKEGAIKQLLTDEVFQDVTKHVFLEKYTITPKKLSDSKALEKLYDRIQEDITKFSDLKQISSEQAKALKGQAEHVKNNMDFMKTLSEIYPYIQLPVHLKDKNIHSELFVFRRKGQRAGGEQGTRFLLHLDMDHIGPLDIHLQMNQNQVRSQFYVKDDEVKHIFMDTMHELEEGLRKKGFYMSVEYHLSEKESTTLDALIEEEERSEGMQMKRYTFDIRA